MIPSANIRHIQNRATKLLFLVCFCFSFTNLFSQKKILLEDDFNQPLNNWQAFSLEGNLPQISEQQGKISITNTDSAIGGVYNKTTLTGNFIATVEFSRDRNVMVALFHKKTDGTIDKENFSALRIDFNGNYIEAYVTDKQNGIPDVLDNTYKVSPEKYIHKLDGSVYSLPFSKTNKKLRISSINNQLIWSYEVKKKIDGVTKSGWVDFFPSRKWGTKNQEYLLALLSTGGTVDYLKISVNDVPEKDKNDMQTGFNAVERDYTWACHTGKAVVVTFGNNFYYRNKDYKWVFWDKFNYVPAWHFSNELQYSYEFVEVWDAHIPGCFEPMSDRLLRYSHVEIMENNPVRKVIHWHYALINPDYRFPDDGEGDQIPEVDEYYYIYPDGQIIRRILYFPKLDTPYRSWHELTESIVISGIHSNPSDHLSSPALSMFDLHSNIRQFFGKNTTDQIDSDTWNTYITAVHFKDHPDAVGAFIQEFETGKQVRMVLDWHSPWYRFTHWPVNHVLYDEPCKTYTPWKEMVSHTSLIGGSSRTGTNWDVNYEINDGRKYREWSQLIFLNERNQISRERDIVKSWKGDVQIVENNPDFNYIQYLRNEKVFEFQNNTGVSNRFKFTITPDDILIHPVIRIINWGNKGVTVKINGTPIECKYHIYENNDIIIWLKTEFQTQKEIEITPETYSGIKDNHKAFDIIVYPNPASDVVCVKQRDFAKKVFISLFNLNGQMVLENEINTNPYKINLSQFNGDSFLLNIYNKEINITKHIIKIK